MRHIAAVVLDVDGTLIDSNDAHAHSWAETLRSAGVDTSFEAIRPLIGMGGDKLLPKVSGIEEDSSEGQWLSDRRGALFKEKYLPTIAAFPGARELVRHMAEQGLQLVVASSAGSELKDLLQIAEVEEFLDAQTSSEDAERSKPDPDIVQAALDKLGCDASQVVMLGDTPYDVEAALRAGISIIALRCGGWSDEDLAGAIAIYDDPADLLANYDRSPLAGERSVGS